MYFLPEGGPLSGSMFAEGSSAFVCTKQLQSYLEIAASGPAGIARALSLAFGEEESALVSVYPEPFSRADVQKSEPIQRCMTQVPRSKYRINRQHVKPGQARISTNQPKCRTHNCVVHNSCYSGGT